MIERINIAGIHFDLDKDTKEYVQKKVGKLDRYMPKDSAAVAHAEVKLEEMKKGGAKFSAEIVLHVKSGQITAQESASSMTAAIDLVDAKIKHQLKKHHDKHAKHTSDRKGYLRKIRRMADRDFWGKQN